MAGGTYQTCASVLRSKQALSRRSGRSVPRTSWLHRTVHTVHVGTGRRSGGRCTGPVPVTVLDRIVPVTDRDRPNRSRDRWWYHHRHHHHRTGDLRAEHDSVGLARKLGSVARYNEAVQTDRRLGVKLSCDLQHKPSPPAASRQRPSHRSAHTSHHSM